MSLHEILCRQEPNVCPEIFKWVQSWVFLFMFLSFWQVKGALSTERTSTVHPVKHTFMHWKHLFNLRLTCTVAHPEPGPSWTRKLNSEEEVKPPLWLLGFWSSPNCKLLLNSGHKLWKFHFKNTFQLSTTWTYLSTLCFLFPDQCFLNLL